MRRTAVLLSLLILTLAPRALAAEPAPVTIERLADGVYLFRTPFDGYVLGSSVAILDATGVTVFDTHTRPSTARLVLAEIRKLTPLPIHTVINSHWHPDHWSGNEVYTEENPNVRIIATEETREFMRHVAPGWPVVFAANAKRRRAQFEEMVRTGKRTDGTPITEQDRVETEASIQLSESFAEESRTIRRVLPNVVYRDRLILQAGGRELRLQSFTGDATGSTVVYLPAEKILLMGDLLVHPMTWTTNSYQISPWVRSLQDLAAVEATLIVPGHGAPQRDKQYLYLVTEFFSTIVTQVRQALLDGAVSIEDAQAAVKLDDLKRRFTAERPDLAPTFDHYAASAIRKAYQEARDGMESRR